MGRSGRKQVSAALWRQQWAAHDQGWSRALQQACGGRVLRGLLVGVSWLSDGIVWYATILMLPWLGGANGTACALRMVVVGALNLVVYKALKRKVARPRPFRSCPGIQAWARSLDEYSFPSGHMLHATAFSTLLCTYYPGLAWVLWPFTALVAMCRVSLGLHYPSDVAVGMLMGWCMASSVLLLF
jgi:undecaprenyl-diphosphatase